MHVVTIKDQYGDVVPKPKDLLRTIVKQPSGGAVSGKGIDLDDMRKDIRLLDVIDKVGNVFEFEDADWGRLCAKIKAFPFGVADVGIVQFCDDVLEAPEKKAG